MLNNIIKGNIVELNNGEEYLIGEGNAVLTEDDLFFINDNDVDGHKISDIVKIWTKEEKEKEYKIIYSK